MLRKKTAAVIEKSEISAPGTVGKDWSGFPVTSWEDLKWTFVKYVLVSLPSMLMPSLFENNSKRGGNQGKETSNSFLSSQMLGCKHVTQTRCGDGEA